MRTRPDNLTTVTLPDQTTVTVDEYGYVTDPARWSDAFAEYAAQTSGIILAPDHWAVIRFMRAFHDDHGVAADQRFTLKLLAERHGLDKAGAKQLMYLLFPGGYVKDACRIAGMRQPRAWSTG